MVIYLVRGLGRTILTQREKWINKKSGQRGVIHRGSQTKQKGWRRAEVVEPRKRLLGRQERGRALAQGQGDLLVRTVRGAPAAWGVEKWGGGGWARQRQRATAAMPLGVAAVRLRTQLTLGGLLGAAAIGVLRRPRRRGGHGLVRVGLPGDPARALLIVIIFISHLFLFF